MTPKRALWLLMNKISAGGDGSCMLVRSDHPSRLPSGRTFSDHVAEGGMTVEEENEVNEIRMRYPVSLDTALASIATGREISLDDLIRERKYNAWSPRHKWILDCMINDALGLPRGPEPPPPRSADELFRPIPGRGT